eukprot:8369297-Pyramimonas_sp.AAC.1
MPRRRRLVAPLLPPAKMCMLMFTTMAERKAGRRGRRRMEKEYRQDVEMPTTLGPGGALLFLAVFPIRTRVRSGLSLYRGNVQK